MKTVQDLTDEQLQECIIGNIELSLLKEKAAATQAVVVGIPESREDYYIVPPEDCAIQICLAKKSGFVSVEHTPEWEAEWNSLFDNVKSTCNNINILLN